VEKVFVERELSEWIRQSQGQRKDYHRRSEKEEPNLREDARLKLETRELEGLRERDRRNSPHENVDGNLSHDRKKSESLGRFGGRQD